MKSKDIAIIGMAARIPGCTGIAHFWESILFGKELISVTHSSGADSQPNEKYLLTLWNNDDYIKSSYVLDNIDMFDAELFGFTPREAQLTDPQFRLCLETAWEALENSGYCADRFPGSIGAFLASNMSDYLLKHLYQLVHEEMISENEFPSVYQTSMDFMATNIAYRLNLTGPCMNIQNWCTSGLTSIHMACKSLQVNDCDMALAGGVHLKLPQQGYFSQGSISDSSEGKCRSFDERASGTVPSNGVAVFVLKKLERAQADNDSIFAVIKGSAINNDGAGKNKLSYHSPSIKGQDRVVKMALSDAGVDAASVRYVEAHGGATEFGDRSELTALAKSYGKSKSAKTILGCVKPNVGHMGNISGIPGFLKTVLSLKYRKIPPTINFNRMAPRNARICRNLPVGTECIELERNDGVPLRAGVHNYAVGGSNAHIILEEAPEAIDPSVYRHRSILLVLSARGEEQLRTIKKNIAEFHDDRTEKKLSDIVYTQNTGRRDFEHRHFFVLDTESTRLTFKSRVTFEYARHTNPSETRDIVLYLGPTNQHFFGVCRDLVNRYDSFRTDCEALIHTIELVKGFPVEVNSDEALTDSISNGLLYIAFSLSLIKLLKRLGVEFISVAAEGCGEFVALHECGIFSLEETIRFFLSANNLSEKESRDNFARSFFSEKHEYIDSYFSVDLQRTVTVNDIVETEYRAKLLQKPTENIAKEMSTSEASVLDLVHLRFYSDADDPITRKPVDTPFAMDALLGSLWLDGVQLSWDEYFNNTRLKKIHLPTYPFKRRRYWISSPVLSSSKPKGGSSLTAGDSPADIEQNIVSMWQKLIGAEKVGPTDNFKDLGGNSFIGMVFLTRLCSIYKNLDISFKDIDEHPTAEQLTSFIHEQLAAEPCQETRESIQSIPKTRIGEKGYLKQYLTSLITKLSDDQADLRSLKLGDIVKDLCFYLRKDLDLVVFTHEIEPCSTLDDLTRILEEILGGDREEISDRTVVRNSFAWLPDKALPAHNIEAKNPRAIFVLSTPRSGSTLLRVMLNRHSRLFAPPELGLLIYDDLSEWYDKYIVSEVSRDGLAYALTDALCLPFPEAISHMMSLVSQKTPIRKAYALLQENIGDRLLVDKTPYYGYHLDILRRTEALFEDPFYIFLHKHPYSMIESFARNRFDKLIDHERSNSYLMAENEWSTINRNILKFLSGLEAERYARISFEQLVAEPEDTMKCVFSKMGLPFEPTVLSPYDDNTMLVGPGDFNILSHDSIDHSLGEKWRTIRLPIELNEKTIALANELEYFCQG